MYWWNDKHYWDICTKVSEHFWEYRKLCSNLRIHQIVDDHVHQLFSDWIMGKEQERIKENEWNCCTTLLRIHETFWRKQTNFIRQTFAKFSPLVCDWFFLYVLPHLTLVLTIITGSSVRRTLTSSTAKSAVYTELAPHLHQVVWEQGIYRLARLINFIISTVFMSMYLVFILKLFACEIYMFMATIGIAM